MSISTACRRAARMGACALLATTAAVGGEAQSSRPFSNHPSWSPDGGSLVFASTRRGVDDLYVVTLARGVVRRVVCSDSTDSYPAWSADGGSIFFHSRREGLYSGWRRELETGSEVRITPVEYAIELVPDPSGTWVVYSARSAGALDLFLVRTDGSERRQLTRHPAADQYASWSPDGERVLFQSNRSGTVQLYTVNADGTGVVALTAGGGNAWHGRFSPDGSRIAFDSDRSGDREIYVMNADGSGVRRLTRSRGRDGYPAWSPDGRRIAFHARRELAGATEVYVMNADGSDQRRVTTTVAEPGSC